MNFHEKPPRLLWNLIKILIKISFNDQWIIHFYILSMFYFFKLFRVHVFGYFLKLSHAIPKNFFKLLKKISIKTRQNNFFSIKSRQNFTVTKGAFRPFWFQKQPSLHCQKKRHKKRKTSVYKTNKNVTNTFLSRRVGNSDFHCRSTGDLLYDSGRVHRVHIKSYNAHRIRTLFEAITINRVYTKSAKNFLFLFIYIFIYLHACILSFTSKNLVFLHSPRQKLRALVYYKSVDESFRIKFDSFLLHLLLFYNLAQRWIIAVFTIDGKFATYFAPKVYWVVLEWNWSKYITNFFFRLQDVKRNIYKYSMAYLF